MPTPSRALHRRRHRAALRAVLRHTEPESWLDVGAGPLPFAAAAREAEPYIAFDGLGPGDGVRRAAADGHIEEAHLGTLPALARRLAGRYDALSMLHHLERVEDPAAELAAAHTVLRPGGHLLIEAHGTPRPGLGRRAVLPAPRPLPRPLLRRALDAAGFTLLSVCPLPPAFGGLGRAGAYRAVARRAAG
ncbi:methyltransferase domain-containing protein [Streptomyces sp. NPDC050560]|uniref:methyltransferase domain-containing protein n=1 Tax=Streptomyces sp. NPDC050560 TaxID=3365630 RepID=UPI00379CA72B